MHRKTIVAATVSVATLLTGGCSAVSDVFEDTEVTSTAPPEPSRSILVTRQWGVVDGMLSVVVQNTTDRTLQYADGVINARTDANELVMTSIEADEACCGVVNLRPGQQYGFYVDVGASASDISRVDVAYRNVSWAPAHTPPAEDAPVRARPVGLEREDAGAVVLADLQVAGSQGEVIAQAFVTDEAGDFLAVVSGRWTCLTHGSRKIRMELFHALPEGARIDRVVVHPIVEDPTRPGPECATPGAAV